MGEKKNYSTTKTNVEICAPWRPAHSLSHYTLLPGTLFAHTINNFSKRITEKEEENKNKNKNTNKAQQTAVWARLKLSPSFSLSLSLCRSLFETSLWLALSLKRQMTHKCYLYFRYKSGKCL